MVHTVDVRSGGGAARVCGKRKTESERQLIMRKEEEEGNGQLVFPVKYVCVTSSSHTLELLVFSSLAEHYVLQ